ncbi:MAG: hypothetical protein EFT35_04510 [Methanophagales archaeon ANME-1-THS]|nr:MAG: hypothetical protein EFT35_04510 [Methanophagales archaeon ANME-1-THS]
MRKKLPNWKIGMVLVGLLAVFLMIPVNSLEPFEVAYQVPVQKESQVPVQKESQVPVQIERTQVVSSQTFPLWKVQVYPPIYYYERWITWRPSHQNEWINGSFTANTTLMNFYILDTRNFNNMRKGADFQESYRARQIISDNFTFKPQTMDEYYFYFHDPLSGNIISCELIAHWYEPGLYSQYTTEYETQYTTEYETQYTTTYKIVKKPLFTTFLS